MALTLKPSLLKSKKNTKKQRDRFVAFAFASADLFLEVSPQNKIIYARGAAQALTGVDEQDLIKRTWLELFAPGEHSRLNKIKNETASGLRYGPILVNLDEKISIGKAVFTAIKMPDSPHFYIAMGLNNSPAETLPALADTESPSALTTGFKADDMPQDTVLETGFKAEDLQEDEVLTTGFTAGKKEEEPEAITTGFTAGEKDEEPEAITTGFTAGEKDEEPEAITTGFTAGEKDEEPEAITTGFTAGNKNNEDSAGDEYRVESAALPPSISDKDAFLDEAKKVFERARTENIETSLTLFGLDKADSVSDEDWADVLEKVSDMLGEEAADGKAAGQIREGQYGLIHKAGLNAKTIAKKIAALCRDSSLEEKDIRISTKTIKADLKELSSDEALQSLSHTISEFEKSGTDLKIKGLHSGLKKLTDENKKKLEELKNTIERVDFNISFQPIINLETKDAEYYETLTRFQQGETGDWIKFGEDVGLSGKLDLAIVERTLNYIHYKASTTRTKFSINISSKSIDQKGFVKNLETQLAKRDLKHRIMLEITDSTNIHNLQNTIDFVRVFRNKGYAIALDNFGPVESALKILQNLPVNFVKIDGKYIRRLSTSPESVQEITQLVQACRKMKIGVIAVCVEEQSQTDLLTKMGVTHVQGHLYGAAASSPGFIPPKS